MEKKKDAIFNNEAVLYLRSRPTDSLFHPA